MKFFLICLTVISHFVSSEASMLSRLSKRFAGSRVERAITEEEFIKNQKAFAQNLESVQSLKIERAEPRSDVLDIEEIMVEESKYHILMHFHISIHFSSTYDSIMYVLYILLFSRKIGYSEF